MQDQVVVVTGASSEVGRAVARAYGARKAKVALLARNREAIEALGAADLAADVSQLFGERQVHHPPEARSLCFASI